MKQSFKFVSLALLVVAVFAAESRASLITSAYGTTTGTDDNDQAGPIRGVTYQIITSGTYTLNGGVSPNVHALTGPGVGSSDPLVEMKSLTWQRSGSTAMTGTFFVSIFDGLTVNSSGTVTSLGTFKGASTNSITNPGANAAMTWTFADPLLNVGSSYQFVFTTTATPSVVGDVTVGQLELNVLTAGQIIQTELVAGNAGTFTNRALWEPVFSMTYNAVPEPGSFAMLAMGGVYLLARGRKRRS